MNRAKTGRTRTIGDLRIAPRVVAGAIRNAFADPHDLRDGLLRNVWIELKRFSAQNVRTVELTRIRGIDRVNVEGPVSRHGALIVSALATLLECERIFEFGDSEGETARLLARNLPAAEIYSFEAGPSREGPFDLLPTLGTRIANLSGDPNTYDFLPYSGTIDLVHIDASQRVDFLHADTDAAFGMLSELGSIVWYGYSYQAAVYGFLNTLAPTLDRPIFYLAGTRLAVYSRWDIISS